MGKPNPVQPTTLGSPHHRRSTYYMRNISCALFSANLNTGDENSISILQTINLRISNVKFIRDQRHNKQSKPIWTLNPRSTPVFCLMNVLFKCPSPCSSWTLLRILTLSSQGALGPLSSMCWATVLFCHTILGAWQQTLLIAELWADSPCVPRVYLAGSRGWEFGLWNQRICSWTLISTSL